jgi:hypothetical protein
MAELLRMMQRMRLMQQFKSKALNLLQALLYRGFIHQWYHATQPPIPIERKAPQWPDVLQLWDQLHLPYSY